MYLSTIQLQFTGVYDKHNVFKNLLFDVPKKPIVRAYIRHQTYQLLKLQDRTFLQSLL